MAQQSSQSYTDCSASESGAKSPTCHSQQSTQVGSYVIRLPPRLPPTAGTAPTHRPAANDLKLHIVYNSVLVTRRLRDPHHLHATDGRGARVSLGPPRHTHTWGGGPRAPRLADPTHGCAHKGGLPPPRCAPVGGARRTRLPRVGWTAAGTPVRGGFGVHFFYADVYTRAPGAHRAGRPACVEGAGGVRSGRPLSAAHSRAAVGGARARLGRRASTRLLLPPLSVTVRWLSRRFPPPLLSLGGGLPASTLISHRPELPPRDSSSTG